MDEKTFACLSRGLLILLDGYCKEHGVRSIGSSVVMVDDGKPEGQLDKADQLETA